MTRRQAFAPGLTACLCFALLVMLAAAPAARSEEDRTKAQEYFNRGVSAAKSAKDKVDSAKDIKEQTWDQLPEEGQELIGEAAKEGAGKVWEKARQSKTLGKVAKQAEKVVKPLAKKAATFVAKKANPVMGSFSTGQDVGTVVHELLPEETSLWIGEKVAKRIVYPLTGDRDPAPALSHADPSADKPETLDLDGEIARLLEEKERLDEQYREWDTGSGTGPNSWEDESSTWGRTAAPTAGWGGEDRQEYRGDRERSPEVQNVAVEPDPWRDASSGRNDDVWGEQESSTADPWAPERENPDHGTASLDPDSTLARDQTAEDDAYYRALAETLGERDGVVLSALPANDYTAKLTALERMEAERRKAREAERRAAKLRRELQEKNLRERIAREQAEEARQRARLEREAAAAWRKQSGSRGSTPSGTTLFGGSGGAQRALDTLNRMIQLNRQRQAERQRSQQRAIQNKGLCWRPKDGRGGTCK